MNQGFFIAQKQEDGTPGRPIGNDEGAVSLFEDLDVANTVRRGLLEEHGPLSIFKINIAFVGEVIV